MVKLAGVGTEAEEEEVRERWERESMVENGVREGREVGIGSGAGRTGTERGEPCRVCELW